MGVRNKRGPDEAEQKSIEFSNLLQGRNIQEAQMFCSSVSKELSAKLHVTLNTKLDPELYLNSIWVRGNHYQDHWHNLLTLSHSATDWTEITFLKQLLAPDRKLPLKPMVWSPLHTPQPLSWLLFPFVAVAFRIQSMMDQMMCLRCLCSLPWKSIVLWAVSWQPTGLSSITGSGRQELTVTLELTVSLDCTCDNSSPLHIIGQVFKASRVLY